MALDTPHPIIPLLQPGATKRLWRAHLGAAEKALYASLLALMTPLSLIELVMVPAKVSNPLVLQLHT